MKEKIEMNDIAKETIEVLNYFDFDFISKISSNFLNKLKELSKNSNIIVKVDENKKLKEQNISKESKELIALIYYDYIADKEEKKEIINIWNKNEKLYQESLNKKYNVDNIFKNTNKKSILKEKSDLPDIIRKHSFIEKIKEFFKKIFIEKNNKI